MMDKPYFCPNCRSNRVKFNEITSYAQWFMKDAISGEVVESEEPELIEENESMIQCNVCQFVGNEMRFIKQAEKEPRTPTTTVSVY